MADQPAEIDALSLRQQLRQTISQKKDQSLVLSKSTVSFREAELALVSSIPESLLLILLEFHLECLRQKVPSNHSYFVTQWSICHLDALSPVQSQTELLRAGKSIYQNLKSCVRMRQHLLGKVNQFTGNALKALFDDIDDIRFLNFQIIGLYRKWKGQWSCNDSQPVLLEEGKNYLLKMANDNADLINLANFKKTKFISPPNPFFLSEDGNLSSMSPQQQQDIQTFLSQLAQERALMLKITLEGTPYTTPMAQKPPGRGRSNREVRQRSFGLAAREEIEQHRQQQIKNIYSIKSSLSSAKLRAQKESREAQARRMASQHRQTEQRQYQIDKKPKMDETLIKRKTSSKNSRRKEQAMSPEKQRSSNQVFQSNKVFHSNQVFQVYGSKSNSKNKRQTSQKNHQTVLKAIDEPKSNQQPQTKVQLNSVPNLQKKAKQQSLPTPQDNASLSHDSLRGSIDKALSTMRETRRSDPVRHLKPKIKIIEEKESPTDHKTTKPVLDLALSPAPKSTTFYKPIQPILEEQELSSAARPKMAASTLFPFPFPLAKPQQPRRSSSRVHFSSLGSRNPNKLSDSSVDRVSKQEKVRALTNNLKNLTIINIYKGEKPQKKKVSPVRSQVKEQRLYESSFLKEIEKPERITKQPSGEMATSRLSVLEKKKGDSQMSRLSQQLQSKSVLIQQQETVLKERRESKRQTEQLLSEKQKTIGELQAKIKEIQQSKRHLSSPSRKPKHKSTPQELSLLERERKRGQIEQKILRDKIRAEQHLLSLNRDKQLRLKETQLQKELRMTLKQAEKEHSLMLKQFQDDLKAEERRLKEIEQLISSQRRQEIALEQKLAQKKLKEQLLLKILQQKEEQLQQILSSDRDQAEERARLAQLQLQEEEREEREAITAMEEEKTRMEQLYLELVRKNQEMEDENQRRNQEINQLQGKRLAELRQEEATSQIEQSQLLQPSQEETVKVESSEKAQSQQALRERIKEELLAQLLRRQAQEQLDEQLQEERKRERLRRIQEQVAETLRAEQLKMEQENKLFLKRLAEMSKKHQLKQKSEEEPQKEQPSREGGKEKESILQQQYGQSVEKESTGKEKEKESEVGQIQPITHQAQPQKQDHLRTQVQQQTLPQQQPLRLEQPPLSKIEEKQLPLTPAEQPHSQPPLTATNQPSKQSILQKYSRLKPLLSKSKTLFIQDANLSVYLDSFLSSFQPNLRAMLLSKPQLLRDILGRGADIWDCNAVGWLDQSGKYTLIGSLSCLQSVGRKYGGVQVQQFFLFDRTNLYQKQLIARRIKEHEAVGWVMQRKTKRQNMFSIRFLVELPKEMFGPVVVFGTRMVSRLVREGHVASQEEAVASHGFSFLMAMFAKQHLGEKQLSQLRQSDHPSLTAQLNFKEPFPDASSIAIEEGPHPSLTLELHWPIVRFKTQLFYRLTCEEIEDDALSRSFLHQLEEGVSILLQSQRDVANGLSLDRRAELAIISVNLGRKVRQVQLLVPIWQYSCQTQLQLEGLSYSFREEMRASVAVPSVGLRQLQGEWQQLQPPFLCILAQSQKGLLLRHLQSHTVTEQQIGYKEVK